MAVINPLVPLLVGLLIASSVGTASAQFKISAKRARDIERCSSESLARYHDTGCCDNDLPRQLFYRACMTQLGEVP